MQSIPSRILCAAIRAVFHSSLINNRKMSDSAGKMTKETKSRYKPSQGFSHLRRACGECAYEKLISKGSSSEKVVLLIHGGSFKVKLLDMYRRLAEKYSKMLGGATVISVDYRTFPKHEFPAQLDDVVSVYREILGQGTKPENIVVIGDSAGANLALTSSLWLRDNGFLLPGHIVCISLWGDATSNGASRIKNAYTDPFYGISKRKKIEDNLEYLRGISSYAKKLDRTSPYVSPCFGEFSGFPPVTLVCGTAELDESDNDTVYEKMKSAGVNVALYKFEGMFHDFPLFSFLPESKEAYRKIIKRINGGV